jgi:16S rRNA (adenine1518-N6/adenine1519-N6)-dimethyltransferase
MRKKSKPLKSNLPRKNNLRHGQPGPKGLKKSLGQNFLMDTSILDKIVSNIPTDIPIIEIGAGSGQLTEHLAKHTSQPIISYEIDDEWAPKTTKRLTPYPHVDIIHADILSVELPSQSKYIVVANIPYNISSVIVDKLLHTPSVIDIYIMIQKELADRVVAKPNIKDYSSFSIFCQTRSLTSKLFEVPAHCFHPIPKVDSSFIRLLPNRENLDKIKEVTTYNKIIRSAFWGKRKTLTNCLMKSPYLSYAKPFIELVFNSLGWSGHVRGQECSIQDFIALENTIHKLQHSNIET